MFVARLLLPFALLACGPALASDTPVAVALLGRLHFPLLHFPIVLLLVSLLVELGLRRPPVAVERQHAVHGRPCVDVAFCKGSDYAVTAFTEQGEGEHLGWRLRGAARRGWG
jgi:hypothetical protein